MYTRSALWLLVIGMNATASWSDYDHEAKLQEKVLTTLEKWADRRMQLSNELEELKKASLQSGEQNQKQQEELQSKIDKIAQALRIATAEDSYSAQWHRIKFMPNYGSK